MAQGTIEPMAIKCPIAIATSKMLRVLRAHGRAQHCPTAIQREARSSIPQLPYQCKPGPKLPPASPKPLLETLIAHSVVIYRTLVLTMNRCTGMGHECVDMAQTIKKQQLFTSSLYHLRDPNWTDISAT